MDASSMRMDFGSAIIDDMLDLNDFALFVAAVEQGSFAAAARRLGIPKSTLSKRVAELEAGLAVRLIHRTSRSFQLTDLGREFYDHARAALIEAEAAQEAVRKRLTEPSGIVRITASIPTAQLYLAAQLPRLAKAHPKLHVQLEVTDRFVDVVQEGFDIAVRSHFTPLADSGLVQRQVAVERIIMVAAPSYLQEHKTPRKPRDLEHHDGLLTGPMARSWQLSSRTGRKASVAPRPRMVANESTVLLEAAIAGLGIACLPQPMCRQALAAGQLSQVLADWHAGSVTTTLVMPHRRGQLPSVRATVEFLADCLRLDESATHSPRQA